MAEPALVYVLDCPCGSRLTSDTEDEIVDTREYMLSLAEELLNTQVDQFAGPQTDPDAWEIPALIAEVTRVFGIDPQVLDRLNLGDGSSEEIGDAIWALAKGAYEEKQTLVGPELLRRIERDVMLQIVDTQWKDHLYSLDHLKEGIGLRGYGQRDPLVEYKKESFELFQDMKVRIEEDIVRYLFYLRPVVDEAAAAPRPVARRAAPITLSKPEATSVFGGGGRAPAPASSALVAPEFGGGGPRPARTGGDDVIKTVRREEPKVGRNDPCPCGSGRKYKKCHGQAA